MKCYLSCVLPCIAVAALSVLINVGQAKQTWTCPKGWATFVKSPTYECVWKSSERKTVRQARDDCLDKDANLASIVSKEKNEFLMSLNPAIIADWGKEPRYTWIGLERYSSNPPVWNLRDGEMEVTYKPKRFYVGSAYRRSLCGYISSDGSWDSMSCTSSTRREYFCQKPAKCIANHFGIGCKRECHCHGTICDNTLENPVCPFGCQRGWMGTACTEEKRDADIAYYCINSVEEQKKYARIVIDTKGVKYSVQTVIHGEPDQRECNSTQVLQDHPEGYITIFVYLDEQKEDETCHRETIGENTYTWTFLLEESETILRANDQELVVTCNFSNADSLTRLGGYNVEGDYERKVSKLDVTHEDVMLEVVDSFSGLPLTEAPLGSAVVLKMRYGLEEGSFIEGVSPYNCEVMASDGRNSKRLLNEHGCRVNDSPVSDFHVNSSHSVLTNWFPLFGFEGVKDIVFRCSFRFCFDSRNCPVSCMSQEEISRKGRFRRDVDDSVKSKPKSVIRTIRVLPESEDNSASWFQGTGWTNPFLFILFSVIGCVLLVGLLGYIWSTKRSVDEIRRQMSENRLYNNLHPSLLHGEMAKV